MTGIRPVRFEPVPSWCTGGSVDSNSRLRHCFPRDRSGCLCLLFRFEGVGLWSVLLARHERLLHCHGGPGERLECSRRRRCPLRTAEQARASLFFQAIKSQRWMPWRQEPMKDVNDCEKLRGAVYWASIRRCPNGETQHSSWSVTPV